MYLISHSINNFRNIENMTFEPCDKLNVIFGENGHGKTNLIESIWMLTGCNSFRTKKHIQLVRNGNTKDNTKIVSEFFASGRQQEISIVITEKRQAELNKIKQPSPRRLIGEFQAVVFSPDTLSLIKNGPKEKRKFLDTAVSMVKPAYAAVLSKYNKAVLQRNSLLRSVSQGVYTDDVLLAWDEEVARLGAKIIFERISYIEKLKEDAAEIYMGISNDKEKLHIEYSFFSMSFDEKNPEQSIYDALQKSKESDLRRFVTSAGPHKDDLNITLNSLSARDFGSQGQQRCCALALKLSEAKNIIRRTGEKPIILLDDVMSELDENRQEYLLKYLSDYQVFMTCCDRAHFPKNMKAKYFHISNSLLEEMKKI